MTYFSSPASRRSSEPNRRLTSLIVCAGLADRFNLNVGAVRVIAVISLLLFFWLTVAIYLGATMLISEKPLIYSGRKTEFEFWRRRHRDDWRHS